MNVLVLAWAANPDQGSEPGIGWAFAEATARRHNVHLVVGRPIDIEPTREAIERLGLPMVVHAAQRPTWTLRLGRAGFFQTSVFLAQPFAAPQVRRLVAEHDIDVVHHVTFTNDWMPSAAMLSKIRAPLIWGPIGGAGSTPLRYWKWFGARGALAELQRSLVGASMRLFTRRLARRATVVLASNFEVQRQFRREHPALVSYVALDRDELLPLRRHRANTCAERADRHRRTALFGGRLLPYKGLRLAISALAEDRASSWSLRVVGDGPQLDESKRLVDKLGLHDRVEFAPPLPRSQFLAEIADADALFMPSMHEAGGWVYAEAAAIGTPVVCLDHCGPQVLLDPEHGHRLIPLRGDLPVQLARALDDLPRDATPDERWWNDRLVTLEDDLLRSVASQTG